jgi:hypothetical protein
MKEEHLSVAIIPFKIREDKYRQFLSSIIKISKTDNFSFFDSKVYHKYVNNFISKGPNIYGQVEENSKLIDSDKSFLSIYKIEENHLRRIILNTPKNKFLYESDKHNLKIQDKWSVSFYNDTYVVINKNADYGYFILGIKISSDENLGLIEFQHCEFFRFLNQRSKKYLISVYPLNNETSGSLLFEFNMKDFINSVFIDINSYEIHYEKPIILHLFNEDVSVADTVNLDHILYKTLRIPPNSVTGAKHHTTGSLVQSQSGVTMSATIEGAIVIESNKTLKELFNKYFPAFLLVLNQRDMMIAINERISEISYVELGRVEGPIKDKLEKLKKNIQYFKFKQVIYTVSFFDEISIFYKNLFRVFDIQILLKDNQESVNEILAFLSDESKKVEEERAKKVNNLLGFISVLGICSLWVDVWELYGESKFPTWYIRISFLISLAIILIIFYNLRVNPNKTIKDYLRNLSIIYKMKITLKYFHKLINNNEG